MKNGFILLLADTDGLATDIATFYDCAAQEVSIAVQSGYKHITSFDQPF
jgi:hypothetical protein